MNQKSNFNHRNRAVRDLDRLHRGKNPGLKRRFWDFIDDFFQPNIEKRLNFFKFFKWVNRPLTLVFLISSLILLISMTGFYVLDPVPRYLTHIMNISFGIVAFVILVKYFSTSDQSLPNK